MQAWRHYHQDMQLFPGKKSSQKCIVSQNISSFHKLCLGHPVDDYLPV